MEDLRNTLVSAKDSTSETYTHVHKTDIELSNRIEELNELKAHVGKETNMMVSQVNTMAAHVNHEIEKIIKQLQEAQKDLNCARMSLDMVETEHYRLGVKMGNEK